MVGIYKITSPIGLIYIGQSINIPSRWRGYKINKAPQQPKLKASFLEHGVDNHIFELVCECDIKELNVIEQYYIDFFNSEKIGLNCTRQLQPIRKSKEQRDIEWKIYLEKQRIIQLNRDLDKEKRLKKLRDDRKKVFKFKK